MKKVDQLKGLVQQLLANLMNLKPSQLWLGFFERKGFAGVELLLEVEVQQPLKFQVMPQRFIARFREPMH